MKLARPLLLAIALGLFLSALSLRPTPARAEAPQIRTQAPGFYRLMLGAFEVTALYDGTFDLDASLLYNPSMTRIAWGSAHSAHRLG